MHAYTLSRKGKRETNQDYIISKTIGPDLSLHLIADGMGGYNDGDLAAKAIAEAVSESLSCFHYNNYQDCIEHAVSVANRSIQELSEGGNKKMGATIGGVLLNKDTATCFWVGDVKILHFRESNINFESMPHSLMNEVLKNGSIKDVTKASRYKHIVTRSVQGDEEKSKVEFEFLEGFGESDLVMICSDGVHDTLASIQIQHFLKSSTSPSELIDMIDQRCAVDSRDNYSLIIVKI